MFLRRNKKKYPRIIIKYSSLTTSLKYDQELSIPIFTANNNGIMFPTLTAVICWLDNCMTLAIVFLSCLGNITTMVVGANSGSSVEKIPEKSTREKQFLFCYFFFSNQ